MAKALISASLSLEHVVDKEPMSSGDSINAKYGFPMFIQVAIYRSSRIGKRIAGLAMRRLPWDHGFIAKLAKHFATELFTFIYPIAGKQRSVMKDLTLCQ